MANELQTQKQSGTLKELLGRPDVRAAVQSVLPRTMTPERLLKVALATVSRSPALAQCDNMSVLKSLMVAAELGLDPSGVLGQGYLVPFNNNKTGKKECQFIPGYRGLITLARRSGEIRSMHAEVVYEADTFKIVKGVHPSIEHEPDYGAEIDDARITGAYAVAEFRDGSVQFEFMPRRQIDAIRKRSKAATSGPWVTDFAEMARKTVMRRLCKYLPLSVEEPLAKAVEAENRMEIGEGVGDLLQLAGTMEVEEEEPQTKSEQLADTLKKQANGKAEDTPKAPATHKPPPVDSGTSDTEPSVLDQQAADIEAIDVEAFLEQVQQLHTLRECVSAKRTVPQEWSEAHQQQAYSAIGAQEAKIRGGT